MTTIQVTITLETEDELTTKQVKRLIETVFPTDVAIEIENDEGGFDYVSFNSVTLEQGTD